MFRIKQTDTIQAYARSENKLLASVYDGGFTRVKEVENSLLRKIPHFGGNKIEISIYNKDKEQSKHYVIKTN